MISYALYLLSCETGIKLSQGLTLITQTACHCTHQMTWQVCIWNRINLIHQVSNRVTRRAWNWWKCFAFHILHRPLLKVRQNYLQYGNFHWNFASLFLTSEGQRSYLLVHKARVVWETKGGKETWVPATNLNVLPVKEQIFLVWIPLCWWFLSPACRITVLVKFIWSISSKS